jgi:hypothetical protein
MDKETGKAIWDMARQQENYVIQAFGLAVTGLGALFFAHGLILNAHLRIVISMTGLVASLFLWVHGYGALRDRNEAFKMLRQESETRPLMLAHDKITKWRSKNLFYFPVTRLVIYFAGVLASRGS